MIIVYTCITGSYDTLIEQPAFKGVKYVCFSDSLKPGVLKNWDVRPIKQGISTYPNIINRYYKILPFSMFPNEDFSLYIDGNILLKDSPVKLLDNFKNSGASIAFFKHPNREFLADELAECVLQKKLQGHEVTSAKNFLMKIVEEGFTSSRELVAGYIILRKHSDLNLVKAMHSWFQIVKNEIKRDQISLVYSLWREEVSIAYLDDWITSKKFFVRLHHGKYLTWLPFVMQNFFKKALVKYQNFIS
jgi:hypothetical protein|tara:strand:+ start:276 stop:1013 length:738 start_codon:yes stop_codon:yes gene_type:complete